jgi:Cu/Ag efflux protein CusF
MRLSRILFAVSLSTGLVFAGTTATTTTTTTTPSMEKASPKVALVKVNGKVETIDAISNILVVKNGKKLDSVSVNSETKITNLGKDVTLSDIKTGENVRVTCKKDEGKLIATDIKVGVAQVKKTTATTTTTTTTTMTPPPAAPVEKK